MVYIIQPKNNNNELFQMGALVRLPLILKHRLQVGQIEGVCRFVLKIELLPQMDIIKCN